MKYFGALTRILELFISLNADEVIFKITDRPDTRRFIIELNTEGQLAEGLNSEGVRLLTIGGGYSESYKIEKQKRGLRVDEVTLFFEGDFYASFDVKAFQGGFIIEADTQKEDTDLAVEWGDEILGLNSDSLNKLADYYLREIYKSIREKLKS